jgi:hypothetical protein
MTSFRIRPRFQVIVSAPPDTVLERLQTTLSNPDCPFVGRVIPGHAVLKIPAEARHFWSPQLDLSIEAHERGTLVRGLYGPHPDVWLLFTLGYGVISISSLFVSIFGFTRVSLGLAAPILWLLPVLGSLALLLYLASQVGQKLGAAQTFTLHHFFEQTIGDKVNIV